MATNKYKELDKILYGTSSSKTANKTANNYKARLSASGINPDEALDKRNPLEKALNLEKDQNIVFDIFEILNRPQQALFNAWKAGQEGGDIGSAAWEGLSGKKDVQFKEILKNYGMEDREGKIDAADILGFAGDVFLDPMDLIPIAGFSKFDDALKAGESFTKAAKNLKTGTDVAFGLMGKGIKSAANFADGTIEKALAKADDLAGIAYASPTAKMATDLGKYAKNGVDDVSQVIGKLENYKQIKNDISRMFKVPDNYLKALLTKRGEDIAQDEARFRNALLTQQANDAIEGYAKAHKIDPSVLKSDITMFLEAGMDRTIDNATLLKTFKEGNLVAYPEFKEALAKMVEQDIPADVIKNYGLDFSIGLSENGDKLVPGKGWSNKLFEVKPAKKEQLLRWQIGAEEALANGQPEVAQKLMERIEANTTTLSPKYTEEQLKHLEGLFDKYAKDKSYRNLMDYIVGTNWKNTATSGLKEPDALEKILEKGRKSGTSSKIEPGIIERLNANIDATMGSKLNETYDMLTNTGYLPHTLTEEGNAIVKDFNEIIGKNPTLGNTRILGERTRFGSVEEINNNIKEVIDSLDETALANSPALKRFKESNAKFMEDNYIKAITNRYLEPNGISGVVKNANMANEILVKETFGDTDEIIKLKNEISKARINNDVSSINSLTAKLSKMQSDSGIKFLDATDTLVPKGYSRFTKGEVVNKLKKYETLMKQTGVDSGIGGLIKTIEKYDGAIAIDDNILDMFEWASKRNNYTGLAGLYNKYMNTFKKWKTASPTFLLNNLLGNSSNLALGGVSVAEQAKYGPKVADILSNGQNYYTASISGKKLTEHQQEIANLWQEYRKLGFDRSALALQELPEEFQKLFKGEKKLKGAKDIVTNGIPYLNNLANVNMDNAARLTIMLKIKDDPGFINRLGVKDAREAISRIMFDPEMLTSFERNKIKKIIPFYTYTKNNLMYHITNIGQNGKKYNQLMKSMKGLRNLATDGKEQNMSDFIKNNLYIPIPGIDKNGNYKILRASLPFGQLLDAIDDPLNAAIGVVTPAIKSPIEFATNTNAFSNSEIEKFPGEKSTNIPFLTKKQEKLLGDLTGLDVPLKTGGRIYQGIADTLNAEGNIPQGLGRGIMNTVTMSGNVNNDELYRTYEEINDLQNIIKQYRQKGINIATISELKKANENKTIAGIDAIFNKYGIKTSTKKGKYDDLDKILEQ